MCLSLCYYSESGSDATEPGELLPMQSIESSDNPDDSNKEQLLVESETYTENTSNSKTEELAIFIQSDADDKGRANCQSGWCKNYCKGIGNTKLAVLLR